MTQAENKALTQKARHGVQRSKCRYRKWNEEMQAQKVKAQPQKLNAGSESKMHA